MATIAKGLIPGVGVSALAGFALIVGQKSEGLPPGRKGNLLNRCYEVGTALIKQHGLPTSYAQENHVDLVASMSSRRYAENGASLVQEQKENASKVGYLFQVLKKEKGTPVFSTSQEEGSSKEQFIYSGNTSGLFDPKARKDILAGNYMRCASVDPWNVRGKNQANSDVLITGTKKSRVCEDFAEAFFMSVVAKQT